MGLLCPPFLALEINTQQLGNFVNFFRSESTMKQSCDVLMDKNSQVSLACFPRKRAIVSPPRFVLAFQRPAVCEHLGCIAPGWFPSIQKFQPVWQRLTNPVKVKAASHLFGAEMWATHIISTTCTKYQTQRRTFHKYSCFFIRTCAEAIFMLRAASSTTAMLSNYADMSSPNIFGNVAIVCATSCGVREIQVKLPYRTHRFTTLLEWG